MAQKSEREWYSIPATAVRQALTLLGVLVALVLSIFGYQQVDRYFQQRKAIEAIGSAEDFGRRVEAEQPGKPELRDALKTLEEARQLYDQNNYRSAFETANLSLQKLHQVRGAEGGEGMIRVANVQGSVEFRRGERGAWKRARINDTLNPGDWVKTSAGSSALLFFPSNTQFRLRSNTMVHLGGLPSSGGGQRSTNITTGTVGLKTSDDSIAVATPNSNISVRGKTEGEVAYDRSNKRGRFAIFDGEGMEVRSANGQTLTLRKLEQVIQEGDMLAEKKELLGNPEPLRPDDEFEIDLDSVDRVQLAWRPVGGARTYNLRISTSELFANALVEAAPTAAAARIGIRGEGNFYWQVAAVDGEGVSGPWSEPRTFRVAAMGGHANDLEPNDQTPPKLAIHGTDSYGRLVIVRGETEPGSTVTINGQSIDIKRDGTFLATVRMDQDGWGFVEIVAADVWDNATTSRERVFIDAL